MKRSLMMMALLLFIGSCSELDGEGNIVTRTIPIDSSAITGISLDDGFIVTVVSDDSSNISNMVQITTYENLFEFVDIDIKDGILGFEFQEVKTSGDLHLHATVALGNITSYAASSGSWIKIDNSSSAEPAREFCSSNITVRLSGASVFNGFGMTATDDISAYISDNSIMQISTFGSPKLVNGSTLSGGSSLQYSGSEINKDEALISGGSLIYGVN